jgi:glycosyltransferase involved in cell wall biosynthesis
VRIIEKLLSETRLHRVLFKVHPNLGAAATIDRGIMGSSGDYVAILNSDDVFAPHRIETLMQHESSKLDLFAFSGVSFCDREGRAIAVDHDDPRTRWYKQALRLSAAAPTAGFALLAWSVTVSTSNFFFNRELFQKVGGFCSELLLAHDWDFVLRALRYTEPRFVPDELLTYRYHNRNAVWGLTDRHLVEGRTALARYLASTSQGTVNGLAPTRQNWPLFFDVFCRTVRPWFVDEMLARYVPPAQRQKPTAGKFSDEAGPSPARDAGALQTLRAGLDNPWLAIAPATALRARMARTWAGTERGRAAKRVQSLSLAP